MDSFQTSTEQPALGGAPPHTFQGFWTLNFSGDTDWVNV